MSASQQQQITLAVVSDIICPWCYIGYKELTNAIDKFMKINPAAKVDVEYRPFLLDPKLNCKEPVEKTVYFLKKFGEQRAKMIMPVMNQRGAELGIKFRWGGIIRQTTSAHRLLMFAYQKEPKLQLALLEKIFEAYFEQEKDIGSHEMLAGLAEDAGVASKDEALEFLASDKLYPEVQAQIMEAQGKGITGVPCTVINQKYAISGGQKSDVYIDIFEKLATREIPVS
ncbi:hypothetical protein M407DRAFT_240404 [Tulasnella calospora MUT 4182]|uniref:DSBA-like thioredoxin domain-containing protein n=1 Tax=Tulasnella calospora MUT 4182 TaxID=1051891 RepID=A0A0C3LK74_9AGAM|nr:hypothetical protein M407DRAFT_240404 [Tulasnella calospora MUT 4182]